jgi:hypothetical protein
MAGDGYSAAKRGGVEACHRGDSAEGATVLIKQAFALGEVGT